MEEQEEKGKKEREVEVDAAKNEIKLLEAKLHDTLTKMEMVKSELQAKTQELTMTLDELKEKKEKGQVVEELKRILGPQAKEGETERECEDLRDQLEEVGEGVRPQPEGEGSPRPPLPTIQEEEEEKKEEEEEEVIEEINMGKVRSLEEVVGRLQAEARLGSHERESLGQQLLVQYQTTQDAERRAQSLTMQIEHLTRQLEEANNRSMQQLQVELDKTRSKLIFAEDKIDALTEDLTKAKIEKEEEKREKEEEEEEKKKKEEEEKGKEEEEQLIAAPRVCAISRASGGGGGGSGSGEVRFGSVPRHRGGAGERSEAASPHHLVHARPALVLEEEEEEDTFYPPSTCYEGSSTHGVERALGREWREDSGPCEGGGAGDSRDLARWWHRNECQVPGQTGSGAECAASCSYDAVGEAHVPRDFGDVIGSAEVVEGGRLWLYPVFGGQHEATCDGDTEWVLEASGLGWDTSINSGGEVVTMSSDNTGMVGTRPGQPQHPNTARCQSSLYGFKIANNDNIKVKKLLPVFSHARSSSVRDINNTVSFRVRGDATWQTRRANRRSDVCDVQMYRGVDTDDDGGSYIKLCGVNLGSPSPSPADPHPLFRSSTLPRKSSQRFSSMPPGLPPRAMSPLMSPTDSPGSITTFELPVPPKASGGIVGPAGHDTCHNAGDADAHEDISGSPDSTHSFDKPPQDIVPVTSLCGDSECRSVRGGDVVDSGTVGCDSNQQMHQGQTWDSSIPSVGDVECNAVVVSCDNTNTSASCSVPNGASTGAKQDVAPSEFTKSPKTNTEDMTVQDSGDVQCIKPSVIVPDTSAFGGGATAVLPKMSAPDENKFLSVTHSVGDDSGSAMPEAVTRATLVLPKETEEAISGGVAAPCDKIPVTAAAPSTPLNIIAAAGDHDPRHESPHVVDTKPSDGMANTTVNLGTCTPVQVPSAVPRTSAPTRIPAVLPAATPAMTSAVTPVVPSVLPPALVPTSTPLVPPAIVPVVPPAATPIVPPAATPVMPPAATPIVPPAATPIVPPAATPVVPPAATPIVPPAATPVVPPAATPVVAPVVPPVVPPAAAPVVSTAVPLATPRYTHEVCESPGAPSASASPLFSEGEKCLNSAMANYMQKTSATTTKSETGGRVCQGSSVADSVPSSEEKISRKIKVDAGDTPLLISLKKSFQNKKGNEAARSPCKLEVLQIIEPEIDTSGGKTCSSKPIPGPLLHANTPEASSGPPEPRQMIRNKAPVESFTPVEAAAPPLPLPDGVSARENGVAGLQSLQVASRSSTPPVPLPADCSTDSEPASESDPNQTIAKENAPDCDVKLDTVYKLTESSTADGQENIYVEQKSGVNSEIIKGEEGEQALQVLEKENKKEKFENSTIESNGKEQQVKGKQILRKVYARTNSAGSVESAVLRDSTRGGHARVLVRVGDVGRVGGAMGGEPSACTESRSRTTHFPIDIVCGTKTHTQYQRYTPEPPASPPSPARPRNSSLGYVQSITLPCPDTSTSRSKSATRISIGNADMVCDGRGSSHTGRAVQHTPRADRTLPPPIPRPTIAPLDAALKNKIRMTIDSCDVTPTVVGSEGDAPRSPIAIQEVASEKETTKVTENVTHGQFPLIPSSPDGIAECADAVNSAAVATGVCEDTRAAENSELKQLNQANVEDIVAIEPTANQSKDSFSGDNKENMSVKLINDKSVDGVVAVTSVTDTSIKSTPSVRVMAIQNTVTMAPSDVNFVIKDPMAITSTVTDTSITPTVVVMSLLTDDSQKVNQTNETSDCNDLCTPIMTDSPTQQTITALTATGQTVDDPNTKIEENLTSLDDKQDINMIEQNATDTNKEENNSVVLKRPQGRMPRPVCMPLIRATKIADTEFGPQSWLSATPKRFVKENDKVSVKNARTVVGKFVNTAQEKSPCHSDIDPEESKHQSHDDSEKELISEPTDDGGAVENIKPASESIEPRNKPVERRKSVENNDSVEENSESVENKPVEINTISLHGKMDQLSEIQPKAPVLEHVSSTASEGRNSKRDSLLLNFESNILYIDESSPELRESRSLISCDENLSAKDNVVSDAAPLLLSSSPLEPPPDVNLYQESNIKEDGVLSTPAVMMPDNSREFVLPCLGEGDRHPEVHPNVESDVSVIVISVDEAPPLPPPPKVCDENVATLGREGSLDEYEQALEVTTPDPGHGFSRSSTSVATVVRVETPNEQPPSRPPLPDEETEEVYVDAIEEVTAGNDIAKLPEVDQHHHLSVSPMLEETPCSLSVSVNTPVETDNTLEVSVSTSDTHSSGVSNTSSADMSALSSHSMAGMHSNSSSGGVARAVRLESRRPLILTRRPGSIPGDGSVSSGGPATDPDLLASASASSTGSGTSWASGGGPVARRDLLPLDEDEDEVQWRALLSVNAPESDEERTGYESDEDFDTMDAEMRRLEEKLKRFERELGGASDDASINENIKVKSSTGGPPVLRSQDIEALRISPLPKVYPAVCKNKTKHLSLMTKLDVEQYEESESESECGSEKMSTDSDSVDFLFVKTKLKLKPGDRKCRSLELRRSKNMEILNESKETKETRDKYICEEGLDLSNLEIPSDTKEEDSFSMSYEDPDKIDIDIPPPPPPPKDYCDPPIQTLSCDEVDDIPMVQGDTYHLESPYDDVDETDSMMYYSGEDSLFGYIWREEDGMAAVDFEGLEEFDSFKGQSACLFMFEDDLDDDMEEFDPGNHIENEDIELPSPTDLEPPGGVPPRTRRGSQKNSDRTFVSAFKKSLKKASKYLGPKKDVYSKKETSSAIVVPQQVDWSSNHNMTNNNISRISNNNNENADRLIPSAILPAHRYSMIEQETCSGVYNVQSGRMAPAALVPQSDSEGIHSCSSGEYYAAPALCVNTSDEDPPPKPQQEGHGTPPAPPPRWVQRRSYGPRDADADVLLQRLSQTSQEGSWFSSTPPSPSAMAQVPPPFQAQGKYPYPQGGPPLRNPLPQNLVSTPGHTAGSAYADGKEMQFYLVGIPNVGNDKREIPYRELSKERIVPEQQGPLLPPVSGLPCIPPPPPLWTLGEHEHCVNVENVPHMPQHCCHEHGSSPDNVPPHLATHRPTSVKQLKRKQQEKSQRLEAEESLEGCTFCMGVPAMRAKQPQDSTHCRQSSPHPRAVTDRRSWPPRK